MNFQYKHILALGILIVLSHTISHGSLFKFALGGSSGIGVLIASRLTSSHRDSCWHVESEKQDLLFSAISVAPAYFIGGPAGIAGYSIARTGLALADKQNGQKHFLYDQKLPKGYSVEKEIQKQLEAMEKWMKKNERANTRN